jgi:DNA-binding NarL/FixJ family response regulator
MNLTSEQQRILAEFLHGLTAKEIARKLGKSLSAVENQIVAMRKRARARNGVHLAALAIKQGWHRDEINDAGDRWRRN